METKSELKRREDFWGGMAERRNSGKGNKRDNGGKEKRKCLTPNFINQSH